MYLLWTPAHRMIKGRHVYDFFLTDDRGESGSFLHAKLLSTWGSAAGFATIIRSRRQWYLRSVTNAQALRIRKHKLKLKARELFGLPFYTPGAVLADAYEDAGMSEEAGVLRS